MAEQVYLGYSLGQFNSLASNWTVEDLRAAAEFNFLLALLLVAWSGVSSMVLIFRFASFESEAEHRLDKSRIWNRDVLENSSIRSLKSVCSIGLLMLLAVLPLGNLMMRASFYVKPIEGVPTPHYSITQLFHVLGRAVTEFTAEVTWSLLIGLAASMIVVSCSIGLTWKARKSILWSSVLMLMFAISCAIPGPMIGTILTRCFTSINLSTVHWLYDRTILPPTIATAWFCFPLPPLIAWYIFKNVPQDIVEQARLEGASSSRIFWTFGMKDHWPQWLGCWLITFCLCFGELSAAQLVIPPGIDTVPRLMLGLLHAGVDEMTAGLTLVFSAAICLITWIGWSILRMAFHLPE